MDTREMFARLIKCEAGGEGEAGMKAVATVVMNRVRVNYGEYHRVCQGDLRPRDGADVPVFLLENRNRRR